MVENEVTVSFCRQRLYVYDACTNKPILTAVISRFNPEPEKPGWYLGPETPSGATNVWEKVIVKAEGHLDVPLDYVPCKEDIEVSMQRGVSSLETIEPIPEGVNLDESCIQKFHIYDAYTRAPISGAVITSSIPKWFEWSKLRNIATDTGNGWYTVDLKKWRGGSGGNRPVSTVYVIATGYVTPTIKFIHCKKDLEVPLMPGNSAKDVFKLLGADAVFSGVVDQMLCRQRYFVFDAVTGNPITNAKLSSLSVERTTPEAGKPGWYLSGRVPKWGPPPPPGETEFPRPVETVTVSADGYETRTFKHVLCRKDEYVPLMPRCTLMDTLPRACPVTIPSVPDVPPGVFVPPPIIAPDDVSPVPDVMTQLVCKSTPPGADVIVSEEASGEVIARGKSPITYRVPAGRNYIVLFDKSGYKRNRVRVMK